MIIPETTMTLGVVSSVTAAVNWARVETVVVAPPLPPVVVHVVSLLSLFL